MAWQRLVAIAGIVLGLHWGNPAPAVTDEAFSSSELRQKLREGGYAVYFRHAATDHNQLDQSPVDLSDCSTQRNLASEGVEQAHAMGRAFVRSGIKVDRVLTSPFCRCIDTANMDELATLLHDDVSVHFIGGSYEWQTQGKEEYLKNIGVSFSNKSIGHHNGHQPEIQMLSATEATGIWYLADNMWILNHNMKTFGTAIYWDRYVKQDDQWLIKDTQYERLYEINETLSEPPNLSSHYLGAHGTEPQF